MPARDPAERFAWAWPLHSGARIAQEWRLSGTYDPRDAFGRGPDLIGEIRDEDTAFQALQASINGHLIIATIHAGDIVQAIERMQTFCNGRASNTNDILADGLTIVIWQTLE